MRSDKSRFVSRGGSGSCRCCTKQHLEVKPLNVVEPWETTPLFKSTMSAALGRS